MPQVPRKADLNVKPGDWPQTIEMVGGPTEVKLGTGFWSFRLLATGPIPHDVGSGGVQERPKVRACRATRSNGDGLC